MTTDQQEAISATAAALDDPTPIPDPPFFLGRLAAVGGPLVTVLGGTMTTLAVTAPSGLATWIQWVTDGRWAFVGVILALLGTWWAYEGAERRSKVVSQLRQQIISDKANTLKQVAGARAETSLSLMDGLSPLFHDLGRMSDSQSVTHGASLVLRAYGSVTNLIKVPNSRACVYYLDYLEIDEEPSASDTSTQTGQPDKSDTGTQDDQLDDSGADDKADESAASAKVLNVLTLRTPHEGRFDEPRANFVRNSGPVADEVFRVIDTNAPRLISNVDDSNLDSNLDCDGKVYRTFLNVPIKFHQWKYGVLSIDAVEPGSLKQHHLVVAQLLGRMMAVGIRREQRLKRTKGSTPHASMTGN